MRNFSNYSAFHHRTTYLPRVIAAQGGGGEAELELLRGELDMVQQSIFTEPDDQTAWWYLQYLMGWAGRMGPAVHHELLREQADAIRGLLEEADVERPYRWAVLALADILRRLGGEMENAEAIALYTKLMELDPDHRQRYESLLRRLGA
jgi:geranylgeranyl transferase type-2 subunit alpha